MDKKLRFLLNVGASATLFACSTADAVPQNIEPNNGFNQTNSEVLINNGLTERIINSQQDVYIGFISQNTVDGVVSEVKKTPMGGGANVIDVGSHIVLILSGHQTSSAYQTKLLKEQHGTGNVSVNQWDLSSLFVGQIDVPAGAATIVDAFEDGAGEDWSLVLIDKLRLLEDTKIALTSIALTPDLLNFEPLSYGKSYKAICDEATLDAKLIWNGVDMSLLSDLNTEVGCSGRGIFEYDEATGNLYLIGIYVGTGQRENDGYITPLATIGAERFWRIINENSVGIMTP